MLNLCKAPFSYSPCRIIRLIKYNTIHKFSQTGNCLWDQKAISAIGSRSSTVRRQGVCHTEKGRAQLQDEIWGVEAASQAFKTVTWTRFSSGVPGRCRILGSAGSNPWPSGCRWASVLYQMTSGSAVRCSWWCFLWSRSRCWSEISWDVFQGKPFIHFDLASWSCDKCSFIQTSKPVWAPLFGRTLRRSCWQRRSSPEQSWSFCTPHRRARTGCSPRCTRTSGTHGRRSVPLRRAKGRGEAQWAAPRAFSSLANLRVSPLQLRTLSTDSLQVSTSPSGSLGKQHNLPLKRASRAITSPVTCRLHDTGLPAECTGKSHTKKPQNPQRKKTK